jgi:YidC/Oxa1 family membrane protein insertase
MEKRMIVAIGLSLLILLSFQMMSPRKEVVTPSTTSTYGSEGTMAATVPQDTLPGQEATQDIQEEEFSKVQTDQYELVFSDIGGSLQKLALKEYKEQDVPEVLFEQEAPSKRTFAMTSPLISGLENAKYTAKRASGKLEYTYTEPDWVKVTKTYTFDKSLYCFRLEIVAKNVSSRTIDLSYDVVGPSFISRVSQVAGRNFREANTLIDGKVWRVAKAKSPQQREGEISWTALKNRYFALIMKPLEDVNAVTVKDFGDNELMTQIKTSRISLKSGQETRQEYLFYAGPLLETTIAPISEDMTGVINYGFFGAVSKVLLSILRFFHSWTHNWGISIIFLTILINLLLFPLAIKSFTSMHRMKKIQPHIQKLRELHKDNPQKLNKETMELYKKYNVNPLGGCLPLLLQMPIFIALYQGLIRSIELRGASFLWIKDLARPDGVPIPFTLPLIGNSINVLPLLMVIMMVVQQKITQGKATEISEDQANQQRIMMMTMPLLFGFMFYNMPSGLVLYWLVNTILMTTGQGIISHRMAD